MRLFSISFTCPFCVNKFAMCNEIWNFNGVEVKGGRFRRENYTVFHTHAYTHEDYQNKKSESFAKKSSKHETLGNAWVQTRKNCVNFSFILRLLLFLAWTHSKKQFYASAMHTILRWKVFTFSISTFPLHCLNLSFNF